MIERIDLGGGCTALKVTEPDADGVYALVTDQSACQAPFAPETDSLLVSVYLESDNTDTALHLLRIPNGRSGLIAWYLVNVGYDPDQAIGVETPILKLIDRVVSLVMLHTEWVEKQVALQKAA